MEAPRPTADEILRRVQLILRRDLKLGADARIPADMPFFGSDMDLDSLDILLLVTSIEKEFGVKVPSSEVGKQIFESVSTLTDYIGRHWGDAAPAGSSASAAAAEEVDPLANLPHAEPFRFVSAVTSLKPGESAEGMWNVIGSEDFFRGHFPGNPIVPGVLLAEALAQISGLAGASAGKSGMLAHVNVRFEKPVVPPATIMMRSKLAGAAGALEQFDVSARVGDVVVASGSITLHRRA
jgi:3-hydroxyacyl-[acyl-carrier-protein] dehydratase